MRPNLHISIKTAIHHWVQVLQPVRLNHPHRQIPARPNGHRAGLGVDVRHIAGPTVGGGLFDVESFALPNGVVPGAVVFPEFVSFGVDDHARPEPDACAEEGLGVSVGDEANVVGVGFFSDGEAHGCGFFPDFGFDGVADGEHAVGDFVVAQDAQHIGLVFVGVDAAAQVAVTAVSWLGESGVVAGDYGVEAEGDTPLQESCEFDFFVAAEAGVGGFTAGVGVDEVVDDVGFEPVGEVPHVEGDAEFVADAAGVGGVFKGAAAAGGFADGLGVLAECQVDADDVVAGFDCAGGGYCGVDAAAHCCEDSHGWCLSVVGGLG